MTTELITKASVIALVRVRLSVWCLHTMILAPDLNTQVSSVRAAPNASSCVQFAMQQAANRPAARAESPEGSQRCIYIPHNPPDLQLPLPS